MKRAPLIALEGIDGTGKGTQTRLLAKALRAQGRKLALFSFPSYDKTLAGGLVAAYLDGRMGPPKLVDSRIAAVLFALDRFERKAAMERARERGALVVCDRYVGSNLAHQSARTAPADRPALRELIERLEFGVFGLPRPDLVIYLDMPDTLARERVKLKGARSYTKKELDAHEADRAHLRNALAEYRAQAKRSRRWAVVPTVEADGAPRSREAIHADIVKALRRRKLIE